MKCSLNCCIAIVLSCVLTTALALPSDEKKPLSIRADTMQYNRQTGIGIYTGHVNVDRGTRHLRCDNLQTFNSAQGKLTRFIAKGNAHYTTINQKGKPPMHASAEVMEYQKIKQQIQLQV